MKSVTEYTCDSGYYMIGSAFSFCEDDGGGIQTSPQPECQGSCHCDLHDATNSRNYLFELSSCNIWTTSSQL